MIPDHGGMGLDPKIDPQLKTDLSDIKGHTETYAQYIDAIEEKLRSVYDPEISVDIYSLGLVYDIRVTETGHVFILMTLTSAWCPVADSLPLEVQQQIDSIPGLKCKVRITMQPMWGKDKIDPAVLDLMGW